MKEGHAGHTSLQDFTFQGMVFSGSWEPVGNAQDVLMPATPTEAGTVLASEWCGRSKCNILSQCHWDSVGRPLAKAVICAMTLVSRTSLKRVIVLYVLCFDFATGLFRWDCTVGTLEACRLCQGGLWAAWTQKAVETFASLFQSCVKWCYMQLTIWFDMVQVEYRASYCQRLRRLHTKGHLAKRTKRGPSHLQQCQQGFGLNASKGQCV